MEVYQQQVIEEFKQLEDRLRRLGKFIDTSSVFAGLDSIEQTTLRLQYSLMLQYSAVLSQRIIRFK